MPIEATDAGEPHAGVAIAAVSFWLTAFCGCVYTYITPYLQEVTGIPESWISSLLLLYGFAGVLGNFSIGSIMVRSPRVARVATLSVLTASIFLIFGFGHVTLAVIALLVPWGMSYATLPVLLQTWVFRAARETGDSEAALSLFVVAFNGAIAIGALVGGMVIDAFGAQMVALLAGITIALSLALVMRSKYAHDIARVDGLIFSSQYVYLIIPSHIRQVRILKIVDGYELSYSTEVL